MIQYVLTFYLQDPGFKYWEQTTPLGKMYGAFCFNEYFLRWSDMPRRKLGTVHYLSEGEMVVKWGDWKFLPV